jgi:hypothetical protein
MRTATSAVRGARRRPALAQHEVDTVCHASDHLALGARLAPPWRFVRRGHVLQAATSSHARLTVVPIVDAAVAAEKRKPLWHAAKSFDRRAAAE